MSENESDSGLGLGEIVGFAVNNVRTNKSLSERSVEEQNVWSEVSGSTVKQQEMVKRVKDQVGEEDLVLDETIILQCLRIRRFSEERGTTLLKNLIEFRKKNNWPLKLCAEDINIDEISPSVHKVLETKTKECNRPILTMVVKNLNLKKYRAIEYQKLATFLMEQISWKDEHVQDNGITLLLDLQDVSLSMLTDLKSGDLGRGIDIFTKFPIKIKKIFIVNASFMYRCAIHTVLFAGPEAAKRTIVIVDTNTYEELISAVENPKHLPPNCVPNS